MERSDVDCDKGRQMGCQTYCCRLLVRLDPDERPESNNGLAAPGFVEKAADGYCINFNRNTMLCAIWESRPRVCREYSCNTDFLLQVAVRKSYTSMVDLVKKAQSMFVPRETWIRIPCCGETQDDDQETA